MNCTHPVIYHNAQGVPTCHLCGAVVPQGVQTDKNPSEDAKPAEKPKPAPKRTRKPKAD